MEYKTMGIIIFFSIIIYVFYAIIFGILHGIRGMLIWSLLVIIFLVFWKFSAE